MTSLATTLVAFAKDADAFVKEFDVAISNSAPHIYVSALPLSPSGSRVYQQYAPKYPQVLSVEIGRAIDWSADCNAFDGHKDDVNSVSVSYDRKYIVSSSDDKTIRLWFADTGEPMLRPFSPMDVVNSVAFSPDGTQILSGSDDSTIMLWDTEKGDLIRQFEGHKTVVTSVAFSRDGKYVVSCSFDATVRVWTEIGRAHV